MIVRNRTIMSLKAERELSLFKQRGLDCHFEAFATIVQMARKHGALFAPAFGLKGYSCSHALWEMGGTRLDPGKFGLWSERLLSKPGTPALAVGVDSIGVTAMVESARSMFGAGRVLCARGWGDASQRGTGASYVLVVADSGIDGLIPLVEEDGYLRPAEAPDKLREKGLLVVGIFNLRLLAQVRRTSAAAGVPFHDLDCWLHALDFKDADVFDSVGMDAFEIPAPLWPGMRVSGIEELSVVSALLHEIIYRYHHASVARFLWVGVGGHSPHWPDPVGSILAPTRGLMMFVEQALEVIKAVTGISDDVDELRKSMSAFRKDHMRSRDGFIELCKKAGIVDTGVARSLVDEMNVSGQPPFGKAYALGLGIASYWAAAMALRFPREWRLVGRERGIIDEGSILRQGG